MRALGSPLALYFALLGTTLVAAIVIALTPAAEREGAEADVIVAADIVDTVIVLIWCLRSWPTLKPGLRCVGTGWHYAIAAGLSLGTFTLASLLVAGLVRVFAVEEINYTEPFLASGMGWGAVFLSVCVQPAIVEELAFRGVILGRLEQVLDAREAVVVSALLFMVLHLSVLSFPHLFIMGLALGWLRVRTGSLYPGMLAHFLHNFLVVLAERATG